MGDDAVEPDAVRLVHLAAMRRSDLEREHLLHERLHLLRRLVHLKLPLQIPHLLRGIRRDLDARIVDRFPRREPVRAPHGIIGAVRRRAVRLDVQNGRPVEQIRAEEEKCVALDAIEPDEAQADRVRAMRRSRGKETDARIVARRADFGL